MNISKAAREMYQRIVDAKINELVNIRHENGTQYNVTLTDALTQQGYKEGIDFEEYFDWITCQRHIKKLAEIKPYVEPQHNIKVGDFFVCKWGYEQTNVDFYQVVKTTKKTVTVQQLKAGPIPEGLTWAGKMLPLQNMFSSNKSIRKSPYLFMDEWHLKLDHGVAKPWNGVPASFSSYH